MNIINEAICTLCGGTTLKKVLVESGYLWLEERLFCIKNYPGLHCSDCKEDYIRKHTYDLFYQMLQEGSFISEKQETIPLYPFDYESHEESKVFHRFGHDGRIFCVGNVPVQREGTAVFLNAATQRNLQGLCREIEDKTIEHIRDIDFITVYAQKN